MYSYLIRRQNRSEQHRNQGLRYWEMVCTHSPTHTHLSNKQIVTAVILLARWWSLSTILHSPI